MANEIYDEMISFASYAFNKSHAACYAYVAFQTAYLKCHYPREFMAALLTSVLDNTAKVIEYSSECQRLGIKVLPPDVNVSRGGFTVDGESIRFGLNAVKSVGRGLIEGVIRERAQRPFRSLYDFCKRMHGAELNRRALENLIRAGAFDGLEPSRHGMLQSVEPILKSVETDARQNLEGQLDLFAALSGGGGAQTAEDYQVPALPEYPPAELLKMEKEVSGLYLSGHPLDAYRPLIARVSTATLAGLSDEEQARDLDNQMVTILCTVVRNKVMTHQIQHADGLHNGRGPDRHDGAARVPARVRGLPRHFAGKRRRHRPGPRLLQGGRRHPPACRERAARRRLRPRPLFCRERGRPPAAKPRPSARAACGCWCLRASAARWRASKTSCATFLTAIPRSTSSSRIPASICARRSRCGPTTARCCAPNSSASSARGM